MNRGSAREAAHAYMDRGWTVVPIAPSGKCPLVRWQPLQDTPAAKDEVSEWYDRWPDAGVGIVTGAVSGLVVLDIDPAHGGAESLRTLERKHGRLPHTVEARTGGGGRHVYFAHPGGRVRNRAGLAPGIDLRADGGLIVAPPSLHASGRRYAWIASHRPDEAALASMPGWLLRLSRGDASGHGHPPAYWRGLAERGVEEGGRNSAIASLCGHLLWHGVDGKVVLELLLAWNRVRCQPPLDDEEVAATVESITKIHARHHKGGARQ